MNALRIGVNMMGTWAFVFIACLVCPLMMLIYGIRFRCYQPKRDGICGVRIKAALQNDETWDFAHQYCGKLWETMGLFMASIVIVCMILLIDLSEMMIAVSGVVILLIQLVLFVLSFGLVSKKILKNFKK